MSTCVTPACLYGTETIGSDRTTTTKAASVRKQLGPKNSKSNEGRQYLGSIFDSNGGAERDINNRVKLAWMKWKQLTGVLWDKQVPIKLKDNLYKTVIKPTITYGAE